MYSFHNILRKTQNRYLSLILQTSSLPSLCQNKIYKAKKRNVLQLSNEFHSSSIKYKIFGSYNPFKILDTWHDLEKLKKEWDPDFNLSKFKQGATQALFTIVCLIQQNCWVDLRGLISRSLVETLQQDKEMLEIIYNTKLSEEAIAANINRVFIQEIVDRKYCDIDITFSSKIGAEQSNFNYTLRIHREYTKGKLPEWTITKIIIEEM